MATKFCSKCGKIKDFKEFDREKFEKDGRSACCSQCITEHLKEYYKTLNEDPIKRRNKRAREYFRQKRKTDINYRITANLRSRIYSQVKSLGKGKADSTLKLLGCSIPKQPRRLARS